MVQFEGKYELKNNENYIEYLVSLGPELTREVAEKLAANTSVVTITRDGNKFTLEEQSQIASSTKVFSIGEPFEEELLKSIKVNSIASLDGNKLIIETKIGDGRSGKRTHEFSNDGLTLVLTSSQSGVIGKRHYKRV